jgi:hypothetical protein
MTVFSLFHDRRTGFMKQILVYGRIFSQAAQDLLTACMLQLKNSHDVAKGGTAACSEPSAHGSLLARIDTCVRGYLA